MSITSPIRPHRHAPADIPAARGDEPGRERSVRADTHDDLSVRRDAAGALRGPVVPEQVDGPKSGAPVPARGVPVRVGAVGFRSAATYLLLWMLVLLGVEVLVFWGGYAALGHFGVLESVSRAAAAVLGDPAPESGVLPALEFHALLPWAVLAGAALAVLWLIASLALVLVHNCICAITDGPSVRVR